MARMLLMVVFLSPFVSACATASTSDPFRTDPEGDWRGEWPGREDLDLMVRVENRHYSQVRISAVWDRTDYFLGDVPPGATRIFWVPGHILESNGGPRFLADPLGSAQELLSTPVNCAGARWVEWRLKRNLHPTRPSVLAP